MRRFLLILAALGLLSAPALGDSTVPSLTAATTLSGATLYVANGGASDNKAGLSTTIFDISAGNVIIKSGGISATMLASTAVTPATYGDSTHVGQFTVDQQGRITAASSVAISGGGGSITATAGGNTQTSVSTLAFGNGFTTTNGSSGTAPVNLSVTDTSKTANYSVAAGDMANALSLGGSGATLTLPAASSTVFAPGMTVNFSTRSATGNWTVTNSTGLTYAGPTTLVPGTEGAFVANADGVTLDFFGFTAPTTTLLGGSKAISASGSQFLTGLGTDGVYTRAQPAFSDISGTAAAGQLPLATTGAFGAVKPDGTTITISAGVISSVSGGAGTVTNNGNLTSHAPVIGGTNGTTDVKTTAAMTDGQLLVGATGADPVPKTISGSCTLAASGVITCSGGSGAITLISTQTASTSASLVFTSSITGDIDIRCRNLVIGTAGSGLRLRFSEDGGSTYKSTGYTNQYFQTVGSTSVSTRDIAGSGDGIYITGPSTATDPGTSMTIMRLANLNTTGVTHGAQVNTTETDNTLGQAGWHIYGLYTADKNPINALEIIATSGTITSGSCSAYAVAQ